MMEGTPSPCGYDVMGKRIPGICTAKRSRLFVYPLKKRAGTVQKSMNFNWRMRPVELVKVRQVANGLWDSFHRLCPQLIKITLQ